MRTKEQQDLWYAFLEVNRLVGELAEFEPAEYSPNSTKDWADKLDKTQAAIDRLQGAVKAMGAEPE